MLLKILAKIRSESGHEKKIKEFISDYLRKLGLEIHEAEYYIAANPGKKLIVSTHMDTVRIRKEFHSDGIYAYGTGVCDAKGSIAAILGAAEKITDSQRELNYTIAFFCSEEEGGEGSKQFAEEWKWGELAIVMEPTDLKIVTEHWGSFDLDVEIKGRASHGSMPEYGINAIERSCELIHRLKNIEEFRITVLKIEGGGEEYVVPESCRLKIDIRIPPDMKLENAIEKLEFVKNYGKFRASDAYEGFRSAMAFKILAKAIESAGLQVVPSTMPSWTDALNLKDRFDVTVWGPGELHLCHTENERIRLRDIEIAEKVLLSLNEIAMNV
jgi:acetylornithine deacetylase